MKYTIKDFRKDFPDDGVCLDYLFRRRYGMIDDFRKFYRVRKRKCYAHSETGKQLHPLSGTIFHKSSTKLTDWFFAMFLFSQSKNGVSAKELQRQLGVTYKCAYRMGQQIRKLMDGGKIKLGGIVEADEAYISGKDSNRASKDSQAGRSKTKPLALGMAERKGRVVSRIIPEADSYTLLNTLKQNVDVSATLITDKWRGYNHADWHGYKHSTINHSKEYVSGNIHTNTIEGYFGLIKRSIKGTYIHISKHKLQNYLNEFSFVYNSRLSERHPFSLLIGKVI